MTMLEGEHNPPSASKTMKWQINFKPCQIQHSNSFKTKCNEPRTVKGKTVKTGIHWAMVRQKKRNDPPRWNYRSWWRQLRSCDNAENTNVKPRSPDRCNQHHENGPKLLLLTYLFTIVPREIATFYLESSHPLKIRPFDQTISVFISLFLQPSIYTKTASDEK